ncbi:hypothetical protein OGZ37_04785 [Lactococcus lactis]|uniref:hypothetical protein n=1 Tax=Lactococcus lactis TaxID=1358 RepID=UPI0024186565|nr:hypothetical protein [Lactococcus lactis]MDG4965895.1 hypothetical protein [Lactococcus lactis]
MNSIATNELEKYPNPINEKKKNKARSNIYKLGKEIAKESYEMELIRENRIDSRFEKLTTFVSLIIAILGYFAGSAELFNKLDQVPVAILVYTVFSLLSIVLILSLIGQFYLKTKYFLDGEEFTKQLEANLHEYVDENEASLQYIYQYGDVHKSLKKRHNLRKLLLQIAQVILIIVMLILFVFGLVFIIS